MGLRTNWTVETCMVFGAKERDMWVWNFREKASNSQVIEGEHVFGEQTVVGHPGTERHRGESNSLPGSSWSHLVYIMLRE